MVRGLAFGPSVVPGTTTSAMIAAMLPSSRAPHPARAGTLAGLALLAAAVGCGESDECRAAFQVCDIASADCREHVFVQTACARGHEGRDVPPVHTITRDEFAVLLQSGQPPTADEQRVDAQSATAMRMLDLLPPGESSSDAAAIEAYARNVLAFYSRSDETVTIVETNLGDVDRETACFVLSHEFVHAQQDIDVGLQDFFDAHVTSTDSNTAIRSVTEGEAVLFSNVTLSHRAGQNITTEEFAAYYSAQQENLREAAAGASSVDEAAAAITELSSSFPYPFGGELVTARWLDDDMAGVLELYDDPPLSTATVLRTLAGAEPANLLDVPALSTSTLPAGWSIIVDDTLGAWILFAVARRNDFDALAAEDLAEDWAGDRLLVAGGPTAAEVALAWTLRFGSDLSAERFAAIASTPPPEGVRSVRHEGHDVTMILAVDEESLALWEATFETAHVEPAPGSLGHDAAPRSAPRSAQASPRRLGPPLPRPVDDPRAPRSSPVLLP